VYSEVIDQTRSTTEVAMKAIINGFRFNTNKAIEIGSYQSCDNYSDFSFWSASLYRTPRANRYFLAGHGGPMTRWAKSAGQNSWTDGSGIIPLDADEALEWAERYLTTEEIETHFAAIVQEA
jgi:hypothetical protein